MSLRRMTLSLSTLIGALLIMHGAVPAEAPAAVESFSPTGTTKQVRQVAVRFSAPMVALGDLRLADPFDIQCTAAGQGHWVDARNWVYDFDQDLPGGIRCGFSLRPDLRALNGTGVSGTGSYAFDTGGPAILRSLPEEGADTVDEEQAFLLKLDAPATVQSVQLHARCAVTGLGEEIPVEVITGAQRTAILEVRRRLGYQYFRLLWKDGATSGLRVRNREMEQAEDSLLVLRCARRLPPATQVTLLWGRGIQSSSGLVTSAEQQLAFKVRPAFFARVQCERANARAGCLPMQPIEIFFSAPVPRNLALAVRLQIPGGGTLVPAQSATAHEDALESVSFKAPFPELKSVRVLLPKGLVDDAGRKLENAARFPLAVKIDDYPPLARFSGDFGILEATEGGVLPVTLRNLEAAGLARRTALPARLLRVDGDPGAIARWLRRVEAAAETKGEREPIPEAEKARATSLQPRRGTDEEDADANDPGDGFRWRNDTGAASVFNDADATTSFTVAKPSGAKAFEVVGIPLKSPGFYVVELKSQRLGAALLGRDAPRYVATAALVTDLAVHFKWGRERSLAWVTHLHDATPVANAQLEVINECTGRELWRGAADANGVALIRTALGTPHGSSGCGDNDSRWAPLLVMARANTDFAFTLTSWNKGIEPGEFGLDVGDEPSNRAYHTVLDRMLFRAGETVSMKHFLRRRTVNGFALPAGLPGQRRVVIEHEGSGQKYTLAAAFDRGGIAESQWKIPAEAKLGDYTVAIQEGNNTWQSATFKVQQFRLPSMRGTVSGPAAPPVNPKSVELDLHVAYLAGGGAGGLPVKLRTVVQPRTLQFADYAEYQFGGKSVVEGIVQNEASASSDFEGSDGDEADGAAASTTNAQILPLTLDVNGSARVSVPNIGPLQGNARLVAELEYPDANGELLTSSSHVDLAPASLAVGIRREAWAGSSQQLRFGIVVLDLTGAPQAQRNVRVALYQAATYSFRKRLVGGFYAYESSTETRRLATGCQGMTDAQGRLNCEVEPGVSGEILIRAETMDGNGMVAGATVSNWVFDEAQAWFGGTSGDRMDLLPEKRSYEVGDVARFQVRMPFREATALVSVERQGVLRSFVTHIDGRNPVVEVPITDADSPNIFVSVLALRGRVDHAEQPAGVQRLEVTALVDLNKPAYRLGVAAIKVGWKPHQLEVRVTSDHGSYHVRDHAKVAIHVARGTASAPAGTEVAVAAVDAALLDLAPNRSWDLLAGMMGESGLEVYTSTAQMQVIGKRHFGRKAVAAGGGGGRDLNRELFDTLLLWKGRVTLDAQGNAQVDVPLNDSLSEFRIVAVASGGDGEFGTGSTTVRTTQDLMLLSGLPPQVREGDAYLATFTVRNATDHAISTEVSGNRIGAGGSALSLAVQRVSLAAGASRDLSWRVSAPVGAGSLRWEMLAKQADGNASDRLHVDESVLPAYPLRTYQATLTQLGNGAASVDVAAPVGAIAGRGGIEVSLQPRLGDALDGVREYLRLYPYTCIEQRLSQAVVLGDRAAWQQWVERLPAYQDRDGLLRYFPTEQLQGDDSLTAYVLQLAAEADWPLPDAVKGTMIEALQRFAQGKLLRSSALPTADLTIRKLTAIEALSRFDSADRTLLDSLAFDPELWPSSALLDYAGIAQRIKDLPDAANRRNTVLRILRARLNLQGTVLGFSSERNDALWWLMISTDSNAARLLLAVMDRPEWQDDLPRLVRGAVARQRAGHWNTTVANAWGTLALRKFSARFESVAVTGNTAVHYGATDQSASWSGNAAPGTMQLPWSPDSKTVDLTHTGTGRPWALVRVVAALPLQQPMSSGFRVRRTVTPIEQKVTGHYSRGDVVRVHLDLEAQSDAGWVVVDDPIPSGASIIGTGLGGQSNLLRRGERSNGVVWPAFEERRFDGFRSYFRFVPKGTWAVEYTVRLNNPGTFVQPATRVEAMYAPEMFAELPNAAVTVER